MRHGPPDGRLVPQPADELIGSRAPNSGKKRYLRNDKRNTSMEHYEEIHGREHDSALAVNKGIEQPPIVNPISAK